MSHEVESMFSAREIPWHRLGTIVPEALPASEAVLAAGLGWKVDLRSVHAEDGTQIDGFMRTVRDSDGRTLGIVGDRYHPIQNAEAFAWADTLLGEGVRFETAGSLYGGRRVFVLANLPENVTVAGDEVRPYFLITNSHDGHSPLMVMLTPIRVVCANTLGMALGETRTENGRIKVSKAKNIHKVRHTVGYEAGMAEARRVLGIVSSYYGAFKKTAEELLATAFPRDRWDALVQSLIPTPEPTDLPSRRLVTIRANEQYKLNQCYMADDLDNIRGTGWGAYNAVADYSDHGRILRGANKADREALRTVEDNDLKEKALVLIRS